MKLKKIQVSNYRQLDNVVLFFQEDITMLAGPNNSGKTTFSSLIKGILSDNKLKYSPTDIPISQATSWQKNIVQVCKKYFEKNDKAEKVVEDIINEITCDGVLKKDYMIAPCEIKIEVTYDSQNDDIRNFAEYIMDFDETKHSFYFIYTFEIDLLLFKKMLIESYEKINVRFKNYFKNKSEDKLIIIKELFINVYSNSLVEKCSFADYKYENRCKMELLDFKKLFNFECINAARQLDDTETDSSKELSKSIISLASKDEDWNELAKNLPDNLLTEIQNAGVREEVRKASVNSLEKALNSLAKTSGGHIGDIILGMDITEETVRNLIKKITCAKYKFEGHLLSESSQGLGYSNMIYLHMQLEEFKKSINPLLVNVFFIEEPESHMHPQMQSIFINYLLSLYKEIGLQGLVTTHSTEMVRIAGLEHLRVIRETQMFKSKIFDLSKFRKEISTKSCCEDLEDKSILENFFDLFFEIGLSEIIFADKVIFYEGDSERLYLKKIITLPEYEKLSGQYIAFIQVGGAYAHKYKQLIEFLKIKTLIITDLDYEKTALNEKDILMSKTTNSTINKFYKISNEENSGLERKENPSVEKLYEWKRKKKNIVCDKLIYIAFQEKDYYARTLEEAMLGKLLKLKAFDKKKRSKWKELRSKHELIFSIPKNKKNAQDSFFNLRDILNSMSNSKTDFMYSVILHSLVEKMLPKYIEEGLNWLMEE